MTVVDREGPIPNNIYHFSLAELYNLYRKAIDHELEKIIWDRQSIPLKLSRKTKCIIM